MKQIIVKILKYALFFMGIGADVWSAHTLLELLKD